MGKPAEVGSSRDAGDRTISVQLYVAGTNYGVVALARPSDTVAVLRQELSSMADFPGMSQLSGRNYHFQFGRQAMNEAQSLQSHGVQPMSIINVVLDSGED